MPSEKFEPVSGIYGDVDEQDELKAIESWVKNHPPQLLSGVRDGEIRMLPSIINYTK